MLRGLLYAQTLVVIVIKCIKGIGVVHYYIQQVLCLDSVFLFSVL